MTRSDFISKCFSLAQEKGFESYELYFSNSKSVSLKAADSELLEFSISDTGGVNFRGIYKGKMGSAFSELIDEDTAEFLVSKAFDAQKEIEDDDEVMLYEGGGDYPKLELYNDNLATVEMDDKIAYVLDLEKRACALDEVDKLSYASYSESSHESRIVNSHGLDVSEMANIAYSLLYGVGKDDKDTYSGWALVASNDFDKIKKSDLAERFSKKLSSQFGAAPIKSGEYKAVLSPNASSELLAVFASFMLNAEMEQKGLSLLKGKLETSIASACLSIVDNPLLEDGFGSSSFDSEGVPSFKKYLVQEGVLKTFMHNLKTAAKSGVKTTANAARSYAGSMGISPSNLYIEPGDISEPDLLVKAENGIYITEFEGMHAGANAVSGDFSLSAKGFVLEGGKKTDPVKGIVVSGNYLDMLCDIDCVAKDLHFEGSSIGSPTVLVNKLNVAGI